MPVFYVRSTDGNDSDNGSTWALAKATLAGAFAAAAAGDTIYVSQAHAESTAGAVTLTSPGTAAAPCHVICGNDAAEPPTAVAATATISTTGANALTFGAGHTYYYGITFSAGNSTATQGVAITGAGFHYFKTCKIVKAGTGASVTGINIGQANGQALVVLDNTTMQFGNTGDQCNIQGGRVLLKNTASAIAGATIPTTLFRINNNASIVTLDGYDLSALGSGKTLTVVGGTANCTPIYINNCKLGSSVTITATPTNIYGCDVFIVNSDSGATNYRHEKYTYTGTQTVETTIVRTGGATDGTTPIAWKIVTTANSKWVVPFESLPMAIWNSTTGANRTVSVYGYWDNANLPKNDEIWIEVSYMGSSATPIATINTSNTKADYLATATDQSSDSSTWGGGDTTTRFAMSVTLSSPQPALAGPIYVTVKAAKASSTFYVDPKIVLS